MAETITLPRSGIVLTGDPRNGYSNENIPFAWLCINNESDGSWCAQCGLIDNDIYGTRDECVAWLDDQLLTRRAALMPADARERVAKELTRILSETFPDKLIYGYADAVLAALGVRP